MNTKIFLVLSGVLLMIALSIFIGLTYFKINTEEIVEEVSIKDLKENTSNFLRNITTYFFIEEIKPRPDPEKWLLEEYYLVTIRDKYGDKTEFVICSFDKTVYQQYIGKKAKFQLSGLHTPEIMIPYRRLITNILVSEPVDPADTSLGYYVIEIYLIHNKNIIFCKV